MRICLDHSLQSCKVRARMLDTDDRLKFYIPRNNSVSSPYLHCCQSCWSASSCVGASLWSCWWTAGEEALWSLGPMQKRLVSAVPKLEEPAVSPGRWKMNAHVREKLFGPIFAV